MNILIRPGYFVSATYDKHSATSATIVLVNAIELLTDPGAVTEIPIFQRFEMIRQGKVESMGWLTFGDLRLRFVPSSH